MVIGDNRNGITNGLATERRAVALTLDPAASITSVGIPYLNYGITTNFTVTYSVQENTNVRNGVLRVNNNDGSYTWDDEYNENGTLTFALQANSTTGDIGYTSSNSVSFAYKISLIKL
jgi:hypothetical protein